MKFAIELDGSESPEAVARVHNAINALYDVAGSLSYTAAVPSAPVVAPGPPVPTAPVATTAPADAELKAAGFGGGIAANATAAQQADLTAPPAPPAPVTNNFPGLDLDADGLPYDPRIHSSSKVKNKGDNKWKLKRGVDESVVAAVTQELRALLAVPVPTTVPAAAPPPPPVPVAPPAPDAGAAVVPPPPVAPAPPPPPPAAAPASTDPQNFVQLMGWVGPLSTQGKLSADTISAVLIAHGVKDANGVGQLTLLMQRPDLIPAVYADLKQAAGV